MLKLNVTQLKQALSLAREIHLLEGAKDRAADVAVHVEDFGLRFVVPPELVRAHIAKRLAFAHEALAALGIELEPGGPQGMQMVTGHGARAAIREGHAAATPPVGYVFPLGNDLGMYGRPDLNPGH